MGKSAAQTHQQNKKNAARAKQKRKRAKNKNPDVTYEYQLKGDYGHETISGFDVPSLPPIVYKSGPKKDVQDEHKWQQWNRIQQNAPKPKRTKHKSKIQPCDLPSPKRKDPDRAIDTWWHYPNALGGLTPFRPFSFDD